MIGPGFSEFEAMLPRMQQLAQEIVDSYGPNVNPETLPANVEIQAMMVRAKDILVDQLKSFESLAKEESMKLLEAMAVLPGAAAALAAVAPMFEKAGIKIPEAREPKPPEPEQPLFALDFEEKYCPAAAPVLVASLLDLAEGVHQPPVPPLPSIARQLIKVSTATAAEVARSYRLKPSGRDLLANGLTPLQYLDRAVEKPANHLDAVDFLARALPRREAVWWASLCLWLTTEGKPTPAAGDLLVAAVRWVLEPGDPRRVAVQDLLTAVEPTSAAGFLGNAVAQTGPTSPYAGAPLFDPEPTASADNVANCLHMAAVQGDATKVMPRYQDFVALGIGIARGKHPWVRPKPRSPGEQQFWPGQTW